MPEKKKKVDYNSMKGSDLETIANDISGMADHDARHAETLAAMAGYQNSVEIKGEHREAELEIMAGKEAGKIQGLYKGIHDAHLKAKKDLSSNESIAWVKKFADIIMPAFKAGVPGATEENYNHLRMYLDKYDINNGRHPGGTFDTVKKLIASGEGIKASGLILDAIKGVRTERQLNNFMELLIPEDHDEYKEAAAKKLATDINAQLKKSGSKNRVYWGKIKPRLASAYGQYINNDFQGILKYAGKNGGEE
jgi:hypothetical protein